jgi:hypothetical protein
MISFFEGSNCSTSKEIYKISCWHFPPIILSWSNPNSVEPLSGPFPYPEIAHPTGIPLSTRKRHQNNKPSSSTSREPVFSFYIMLKSPTPPIFHSQLKITALSVIFLKSAWSIRFCTRHFPGKHDPLCPPGGSHRTIITSRINAQNLTRPSDIRQEACHVISKGRR